MDNNLSSDDIKELNNLREVNLAPIANEIVTSENSKDIKNLIDEFNKSQAKKSVVRVTKYNEFLDSLFDEIKNRFNNNSQEFTNDDLMTYLQSMQGLIDKSNKYLVNIPESSITINQININDNRAQAFDAESRRKIRNIVKYILSDKNKDEVIIEGDENEQKTSRDDDGQSSDSDQV